MSFKELLKAKRIENGMSMQKLAILAGVSKAAIFKYEKGDAEPTLKAANAICKALGVTITVGDGANYIPVND